jgi:hypothetical protein
MSSGRAGKSVSNFSLSLSIKDTDKAEHFGIEFHAMWDGDVVKRAIETTPSRWDQEIDPEI